MFDPMCPCEDCKKAATLQEEPFMNLDITPTTEAVNLKRAVEDWLSTSWQYRPLAIYYTPRCNFQNFGTWLYFTWNFGYGWEEPYTQLRQVGFRICGVSVSWTKRWKG